MASFILACLSWKEIALFVSVNDHLDYVNMSLFTVIVKLQYILALGGEKILWDVFSW